MELENKVMKLYEDILEPKEERKIVLLLKYVIVDREFDLKKIKQEIGVPKTFIEKIIEDNRLLLKYFTEEEIKKVRLRLDNILGKNNKLIRFINLVLIKKETNLKKIVSSIPITVETIKSYLENKEKMLTYLTEEEYNGLLNILNPMIRPKTQLEKLIEAVMIEGKNDLETIEKEICIKGDVIKRFISEPEQLEKLLSKEDLNIFVDKINKIFKEKELIEYQKDRMYVAQIINDILDTRYLYADICAKHLFSVKKFEKYLYDEEYMKKEFPKITSEMIKSKIKENDTIRIRRPYDMFVIEDRFCVMIAKKDVHYLNQFDNKKINVASYYIGTGANLNLVIEHFKLHLTEVLAILSSPKLEQILDEKYYNILKHCLDIENKIWGNDLNSKKQLIIEVTSFLEQNNFDIALAMLYFKIPEALFKEVMSEIIKLPYASAETKQTIKAMISSEQENEKSEVNRKK